MDRSDIFESVNGRLCVGGSDSKPMQKAHLEHTQKWCPFRLEKGPQLDCTTLPSGTLL
jgi:hypothetical protein